MSELWLLCVEERQGTGAGRAAWGMGGGGAQVHPKPVLIWKEETNSRIKKELLALKR